MRVITEEMLQLIEDQEDDKDFPFNNQGLKEILSKYLVEIDQLTVTKLRTMSESRKIEGAVLAKVNNQDHLHKAIYADSVNKWFVPAFGDFMSEADFEGWIPMPLYKPEQ